MTVLAIAGATGVVGRKALAAILETPTVTRVVAVGRREVDFGDARVASRVADLQDADAIAEAFGGPVEVGVCSLGTTRAKAGSAEAFRAVDLHAVVRFAEACRARGATRFVLVSSLGASAKSAALYLRTKGEAEDAVAALGFDDVTIVRPSVIDDEGARDENRLGEKIGIALGRAVFAVLGRQRRYAPVTAETIGRAVAAFAVGGASTPGVVVVESEKLHAFGAD